MTTENTAAAETAKTPVTKRAYTFMKDKVVTKQNVVGAALTGMAVYAFGKDTKTGKELEAKFRANYPIWKKKMRDKLTFKKNGNGATTS